MKNTDLAQKIKELRTRKGFSQEQLADTAQINLRTVQRIEAGETEPRGDTLQRLANALNVTADELIDWAEQEDNSYLVSFNLSALGFIVFPLLGVIIPLALWLVKKDKIKNINDNAKKLINFQITWCILFYLPFVAMLVSMLFHSVISLGAHDIMILVIVPILFYGYNILFVCLSAYRAYRGQHVLYKPAIPFLR